MTPHSRGKALFQLVNELSALLDGICNLGFGLGHQLLRWKDSWRVRDSHTTHTQQLHNERSTESR